jgi:hypothetical protein
MAVPPLSLGAENDTLAEVLPVADALTPVGAPGTLAAVVVIELLAALLALLPTALVAYTVKV